MAIGQTNAKINAGGGETPQLYDTRILNSASAPQGWAYVCSDNYRTFSSSTLPTLYNDINTKLQNATDIIIENKNIGTYNEQQILYCNNTYYQGSYYYNNGSWTNVGLSNIVTSLTDNTGSIIIAVDEDTAVYKINPLTNEYKKIANSSPLTLIDYYSIGKNGGLFKKEYNNTLYLSKGNNNYICEIKSNYSDNTFTTYSFNEDVLDYEFVNENWYLLTYNYVNDTNYYHIYKGSSLSNNDLTDTTKWELVYSDFFQRDPDFYPTIVQLFYYNGRFIIFGTESETAASTIYFYTDNEFDTVSEMFIFGNTIDTIVRINENYLIFVDSYDIYWCEINKINSLDNWHIIGGDIAFTDPISYPINSTMFFITDEDEEEFICTLDFCNDKYVIDNSIITITYSKYQNFKICQYSDLTLLNQVYTKYGISNYWNIYNNAVSIPVNKQQYSIMYVGDNFNDNLYNS